MIPEWKPGSHSRFIDRMNTLEQVISSVHLSINAIVYCKFFESEAILYVSVQLLAQQFQMGFADDTLIQFISINKDRTYGNWLWDWEFQITRSSESSVLVDLFFFFFVYVTKEVTVQQMLKDHSSQRSLGHFVYNIPKCREYCRLLKGYKVIHVSKSMFLRNLSH